MAILELVQAAIDAHRDELLIQRWIVGGYEKQVAFEDFKRAAAAGPAPEKTAEEIHAELAEKFNNIAFRRVSFEEMG